MKIKSLKVFNKSILLRLLAIFVIVTAIFSITIVALNHFKIKENKPTTSNSLTNSDLPKIYGLDFNKNPILYDFVNSSISYKSNIDPSNFGFYYAIAQDKSNKSIIYVEYYTYAEKLSFPSLGTAPVAIKLNDSEIKYIDDFSKKISSNRLKNEMYKNELNSSNWRFILISQYNTIDSKSYNQNKFDYCDAVGRWAGIPMNSFISSPKGSMSTTVNSGFGWPIEWLRKTPYSKLLLKYEGYDVNDKFWDSYNIGSSKIYKNNSGQELKVEVAQLDRFKILINGDYVSMNEVQLKKYLRSQGWR